MALSETEYGADGARVSRPASYPESWGMCRQAGSHWKVLSARLTLDLTFYKEKQVKNREQEDKADGKLGGWFQGHGGDTMGVRWWQRGPGWWHWRH